MTNFDNTDFISSLLSTLNDIGPSMLIPGADEESSIISSLKDILEQKGKFPVKVSWGLNYHEMKDITERFV